MRDLCFHFRGGKRRCLRFKDHTGRHDYFPVAGSLLPEASPKQPGNGKTIPRFSIAEKKSLAIEVAKNGLRATAKAHGIPLTSLRQYVVQVKES